MELGLAGATVCVQGGTQGMGRATAETFAAEGARAAVLTRDKARLDRDRLDRDHQRAVAARQRPGGSSFYV